MKSLKYIIVSAILAIGLAAPMASAKGGRASKQAPSEPSYGATSAAWLVGINLTADQQKKVDAINDDAQKQIDALAPEDRQTKGADITNTAKAKLRAVLTAEQQTTFDANAASTAPATDASKSGKSAGKTKKKKSKGGSGGGEE